MSDSDNEKTAEIWRELKRLEAEQKATMQPPYTHPCPSCGHCPTCGRGRSWGRPYYPYYPYNPYAPYWMVEVGSPTITTTGSSTGITFNVGTGKFR